MNRWLTHFIVAKPCKSLGHRSASPARRMMRQNYGRIANDGPDQLQDENYVE